MRRSGTAGCPFYALAPSGVKSAAAGFPAIISEPVAPAACRRTQSLRLARRVAFRPARDIEEALQLLFQFTQPPFEVGFIVGRYALGRHGGGLGLRGICLRFAGSGPAVVAARRLPQLG